MQTISVTVGNQSGLHARPARLFVMECQKYDADITVRMNGKSANAKSILAILALGAEKGTGLQIDACGADEEKAIETIRELFGRNLDEL